LLYDEAETYIYYEICLTGKAMTVNLIMPLAIVFFFALSILTQKRIQLPTLAIDPQKSSLNFNAYTVKIFSIGFKRSLADLLWIKTLLNSDHEHYKEGDLGNWMYLRFHTIAILAPFFYDNYYIGSRYLMIIKDDLKASEKLLHQGLEHFPDDVGLNWQMGYLYGIEYQEPQKALPYFDRIRFHPNRPKMLDSLYTKFAANNLGYQEAFDYAYTVWSQHQEGELIKERLYQQLYTLKALMDLECLNQKKENCSQVDFDGNPYVNKKGRWGAPKELIQFKKRNN
jgi:hypothetical protein